MARYQHNPDSKVHGANIGPIWVRQDPEGPHTGPMNFAFWEHNKSFRKLLYERDTQAYTVYMSLPPSSQTRLHFIFTKLSLFCTKVYRLCYKNT